MEFVLNTKHNELSRTDSKYAIWRTANVKVLNTVLLTALCLIGIGYRVLYLLFLWLPYPNNISLLQTDELLITTVEGPITCSILILFKASASFSIFLPEIFQPNKLQINKLKIRICLEH